MSTSAEIIDQAVGQLAEYFTSILADDQIVNKNVAVAELFEDFGDHLKANTNAAQSFHDRKRRIAEQLMADEAEAKKKPPTRKEHSMTRADEMQEMSKFIKTTPNGFTSVAKQIVDKGTTSLTEHEYINLWKADSALHKEAKESDAQAFAREFGGERTAKHDAYDVVHRVALGYPG
jgi:hypothetical protein